MKENVHIPVTSKREIMKKLKRAVASAYVTVLAEKIHDPLFLLFKKKDIKKQSYSPFITTFVQLKSIL